MAGSAVASLVADLTFGEPPAALHPTVGMGNWLRRCERRRRATSDMGALIEGSMAVAGGVALAGGIASLVDGAVRLAPRGARPMLRGVALKPALSMRALLDAGRRVQRLLEARRLDDARRALSRDLVSRDTGDLTPAEVAGAAIESVAENLSDGFIGPLIAFRFGGLSGAYMYRLINTADAMFGYRTRALEWFGKPAAVADDLVNLIPARVTALLIAGMAPIGGGSSPRAMRVAWRDAWRTSSPNAGWPMAAMAGALDVRLTKRGHYVLNGKAPAPRASDIGRCCAIAAAAGGLAATLVDAL